MKQTMVKRGALLLAFICLTSLLLSSCATTLRGTYTNSEGVISQSFTFEEGNKVKASAFGINIEGEYKIEDDKITITYSLLGISYDWEKSFVKKGNSIFIDGTEFIKE